MRLTPIVSTAVLAASLLVVPVASLPAPGPVTPSTWTLPLASAAASATAPSAAPAVGPSAAPDGAAEPSAAPAAEPAPETLGLEAQATEPFDLVAVTWDGSQDELAPTVEVRVLEDGAWTGWEQLPVMDEGPDAGTEEHARARSGTSPLLTSQAEGVEVRLAVLEGPLPSDAQVELVDAGTAAAEAAPLPMVTAGAAIAAPAIVTRAAWGADESLKNGSASTASTIKAGIVHHTASTNSYSASEAAAQVRAIYAYHTNSLNWNDIGYNFLVDKFGTVYEGRGGGLSKAVVGAHSGGFNSETVGVSAIGNYEVGAAPAAMVDSIAKVLAWKLDSYGRNPTGSTSLTSQGGGTARWSAGTTVTVRTVLGHRDVGLTACPGRNLYPALDSIRTKAAAYVAQAQASHNPVGAVERGSSVAGGVQVVGSAKDPDSTAPVDLHVYVNGAWGGAHRADKARADGRFGFDISLATPVGSQQVCVYAINQGLGTTNPLLGCTALSRQGGDPLGNLELVQASPGGVRLAGWVLDPDTPGAVSTHVYVDGRWTAGLAADRSRPDVGRAYPLMGAMHGFDTTLRVSPGAHQVCVYAINVAAGSSNPLMGCRSVSVIGGNPIGNFEGLRAAPGSVTVDGWTLDPDVTGAIPVHVYVDGRWGGQVVSAKPRLDVRSAYPAWSEERGFSVTLAASSGTHQVCVYAINAGTGNSNPLVGCRSVSVG